MKSWCDPIAGKFIHMTSTSDFHPVRNNIMNPEMSLHIQQYFIQCHYHSKISFSLFLSLHQPALLFLCYTSATSVFLYFLNKALFLTRYCYPCNLLIIHKILSLNFPLQCKPNDKLLHKFEV